MTKKSIAPQIRIIWGLSDKFLFTLTFSGVRKRWLTIDISMRNEKEKKKLFWWKKINKTLYRKSLNFVYRSTERRHWCKWNWYCISNCDQCDILPCTSFYSPPLFLNKRCCMLTVYEDSDKLQIIINHIQPWHKYFCMY